MTPFQVTSLLATIAARQTGESGPADRGTAPVTLTIGYVSESGQCQHDGLVITNAQAAIVAAAVAWADERRRDGDGLVTASAHHGGLFIR